MENAYTAITASTTMMSILVMLRACCFWQVGAGPVVLVMVVVVVEAAEMLTKTVELKKHPLYGSRATPATRAGQVGRTGSVRALLSSVRIPDATQIQDQSACHLRVC